MKIRSIGLSLFLFICLVIATSEELLAYSPISNNCNPVAVGDLQLFSSTVMMENHFLVKYNVESIVRNSGLSLNIKNIYSQKEIEFQTLKNVKYVGVSEDLAQVITQSATGNHSELFIFNNKSELIRKTNLPLIENIEEDFRTVEFDSVNNQWIMVTEKRVLVYSLINNTWKVIYEFATPTTNSVTAEWINEFNNLRILSKTLNNSAFMFVTTRSIEGKIETVLHVYDYESLNEIRNIVLPGQSSVFILDQSHFLFSGGGEFGYNIVDVKLGTVKAVSELSALNISKTVNSPLLGINGNFGYLSESGEVSYFSNQGLLIQKKQIPAFTRWSKIIKLGQGQKLLLLDQDQLSSFIYDIASGEFVRLPQVMNGLFNTYRVHYIENKLYIMIISEQTGQFFTMQYELNKQCDNALTAVNSLAELKDLLRHGKMTVLTLLEQQDFARKNYFSTSIYSGLSDSDNTDWKRLIQTEMQSYLTLESISNVLKSFDRIKGWIKNFQPVLQALTDDEKENLIDRIAISLSEKLHKLSAYSEVSISKLANLYVANLKLFFGLPTEPRTDFVLLSDFSTDYTGKTLTPILFSSNPIDGLNGPSPEGFYIKRDFKPMTLNGNEKQDYSYSWTVNNRSVVASGHAQLVSLNYLTNKESSPRYNEYWADQQLVGAIVVSSNLGEPMWLVRKYLAYFEEQGFDFGAKKVVWPTDLASVMTMFNNTYLFPEKTIETDNIKTWFQNFIANGQLDYWIKEAHSGGNDEVIFFGKKNAVIKGTKNLANGKQEIIYIVYPTVLSFSKLDQVPLTNIDFANSLKAREQSPNSHQLMYINASCWSASKARQEIIAARSPILAEIATTISTLTFENKPTNHLNVLLNSFREGLDYDQIAERLDAVKPQDGTKNPYIMPNESEYEKLIWNTLKSALDYTVKIQ